MGKYAGPRGAKGLIVKNKNKKKIRGTAVMLKNPNAPYKLSTYVQLTSLSSEV